MKIVKLLPFVLLFVAQAVFAGWPPPVEFEGLQRAVPVSHNRIELFFPEANSGPTTVYYIYLNDSPYASVAVVRSSLQISYDGNLMYTLKGLQSGTYYSIKMVAANWITGATSDWPQQGIGAATFSDVTADFDGVERLDQIKEFGEKKVRVSWSPGLVIGDEYYTQDIDTVGYEVIYTDSWDAQDLFNPEKSTKISVDSPYIASITVSNLKLGWLYYFRVRAIHRGWKYNHGENPYVQLEQNTRFLSIRTSSSPF